MSSIKLKEIRKSFYQGNKKIEVIRGASMEFKKGLWYTIHGVSGSGKTTLLNIAGGIEKPDSGEIIEGGKNIYKKTDSRLSAWRNNKIGFVFQFFHLLSELSVEKNILLPAQLKERELNNGWYNKIIDILDLGTLLKRRPATLSGGEKQRAALARAVINRPDFILADEPTGDLDSGNSRRVTELLNNLKVNAEVGILYLTHESGIYKGYDIKILLENGKLFTGE